MALFSDPVSDSPSRVLARKYRPGTFKEMIGQEALVQILTNSIEMNRLPHAFLLTGIRGVGKTTTARIIARALNCIGTDGQGTATASPCGICEPCISISHDRHIDVIEMDAASRTGVEDVRDVIEGGRYKAVSARYKVYIIDEVHMLSKNAFNAFLKTLEEPPPHLKFIFATTELRKVPDTILSRCMRLQLNRIETETLEAYLQDICRREGRTSDQGSIRLIARAADGSVRDGLSLLDQAMTLSDDLIKEEAVLKMLGLSDRTLLFQLFKTIIQGQPQEAFLLFHQLYLAGSDPLMILHDLMDLTHWISLQKTGVASEAFPGLDESHLQEARELENQLSFPMISRCWQTLLKGIQEASLASSAKQAVEITLLRLCYLAPFPTSNQLIQSLFREQETSSDLQIERKTSSLLVKDDPPQILEKLSLNKVQTPESEIKPETKSRKKTESNLSLSQSFKEMPCLLDQKQENLNLSQDHKIIEASLLDQKTSFIQRTEDVSSQSLEDLASSEVQAPKRKTKTKAKAEKEIQSSLLQGVEEALSLSEPNTAENLKSEHNLSSVDIVEDVSPQGSADLTFSEVQIPDEKLGKETNSLPQTYTEMIELLDKKREAILKSYLENDCHLISYAPRSIRLRFEPHVPKDKVQKLRDELTSWTNTPWTVTIGDEPGEPTLSEQSKQKQIQRKTELVESELVQSVLTVFPGAEIEFEDNP